GEGAGVLPGVHPNRGGEGTSTAVSGQADHGPRSFVRFAAREAFVLRAPAFWVVNRSGWNTPDDDRDITVGEGFRSPQRERGNPVAVTGSNGGTEVDDHSGDIGREAPRIFRSRNDVEDGEDSGDTETVAEGEDPHLARPRAFGRSSFAKE